SVDRLLTKAEPSVPHWRSPRFGKRAAIEIDASPNVNELSEPIPPLSAAAIAEVLTVPNASPAAVKSVAGPQAPAVGIPHVRISIVATVPPFERLYVISLSPTVRTGVTPLVEQFVGVALGSQNFWFSSKSMFVVPDGFWTRDQNSSRNWGAVPPSAYSPNVFRSLLLGGIETVTTVD